MTRFTEIVKHKLIETCFQMAIAISGLYFVIGLLQYFKLKDDDFLMALLFSLSSTGLYCCLRLWSFYKVAMKGCGSPNFDFEEVLE